MSCQSQTKGSLVTSKGEGGVGTCTFPFTHSGTTYNSCASPDDYGGVGWCAWDTTYLDGRWGYCSPDSGCPGACAKFRDQTDYRGSISKTESGLTCQKWTAQSPQSNTGNTPSKRPDSGLGDHNYCRNPDGADAGAWCYTTSSGVRWEVCNVPKCIAATGKGTHKTCIAC